MPDTNISTNIKKKILTVFLEPHLKDKIRKIAKKENRTMSNLAETVIRDFLRAEEERELNE